MAFVGEAVSATSTGALLIVWNAAITARRTGSEPAYPTAVVTAFIVANPVGVARYPPEMAFTVSEARKW